MHADDDGLDLQHLARILQDEADAGQAHDEEDRGQDARHYRPGEG